MTKRVKIKATREATGGLSWTWAKQSDSSFSPMGGTREDPSLSVDAQPVNDFTVEFGNDSDTACTATIEPASFRLDPNAREPVTISITATCSATESNSGYVKIKKGGGGSG